ncbi:ABC transporter substrate-binding protein [Thermopetrobacter sp. TC1]|uniref:ABC transporter substrate-binding protein n=1 Tax=Thermopetrobacter sp. TC1 TaxID=1495045 RepID=UPI0005703F48|nr:ABC transporter substrate-binding protein [Thermopetrobacter sp. TC1]
MKKLRTLAVSLVALGVMAGAALAKEWKVVRIGTEGAYPPFNYFDSSGKLQGFDIDIAKALCDKMKVKCVFVAQDWDGIIPGLLAKKYDAIVASMSITEERKKKVDFTDPYYRSPAIFVAPKNTDITDVSPKGMKGKVIGAQSSTIHANYLEDNYKDSTIKLYKTQDEVNADLAAGRLDAALADKLVLFEWLKTKDGQCCKFIGPDIKDPKWFGIGAGIAVRKEDQDLKQMLNKALKEILADGTYAKINKKYFPFSIY